MLKQIRFEHRIIALILFILFIVTGSGILAYKGLMRMVNDVDVASRSDKKLSEVKQILLDLSEAESNVKSYSLTKNGNYLIPFYSSVSMIDGRIHNLSVMAENDSAQRAIVENFTDAVEKKYVLLDSMLALHYDEKITDEVNRISKKLTEEEKKQFSRKVMDSILSVQQRFETIDSLRKEKKNNIFKRIFGRKTKEAPDSIHAEIKKPSAVKPANPFLNVKKEIAAVKNSQVQKIADLKKKELDLISENKNITDQIRLLVANLEKREGEILIQKAGIAKASAEKTNQLVLTFCVTASLLLLFVSIVIFVYIRRSRSYGQMLKEAKTNAENFAKAKETFLANMSHEIRTPLHAIIGFTSLLFDVKNEKERNKLIHTIKKSSEHLLQIVNDILDFSKIEAGKLKLENIPFNIREAVNEIEALLKAQVKNKSLLLRVNIKENVPEFLSGDVFRLKQILINLAGNAIKYTERGKVDLDFSWEQNKSCLKCIVKDTGIGISKRDMKKIFNPFEQVSNHSVAHGGTGLGLSITKLLVELQSGNITMSSERGAGTIVTVEIPYKITLAAVSQHIIKPDFFDMRSLEGKKILIADDSDLNRVLLSQLLQKWNVQFSEAKDGKEALQQLEKQEYDLLLMDVRMPEMDGLEATMKIRAQKNKSYSNIPIIALTAAVTEEEMEVYRTAGMNDILAKPFQENELLQKIIPVFQNAAVS